MKQRVFRNVGTENSDAGESPKRKNIADVLVYALLSAFHEKYKKLRNIFFKFLIIKRDCPLVTFFSTFQT